MKLSNYEKETPVWVKIQEEVHLRLDVLRQKNDGDWDALETARIRGAIATYKEILEWGKNLPIIT